MLVSAEEKRLETAGGGVMGIEFFDEFLGGGENFGLLKRGLVDGEFLVAAASVEAEFDFSKIVVPIESVFHFVAVEILFAVSDNFGRVDSDFMFAKDFLDEILFFGKFVVVVKDLPGGSREIARVFRLDTILRGVLDFSGDGFIETGFLASNFEVDNSFARKGAPEENLTSVGVSGESLAAWNKFFDLHKEIIADEGRSGQTLG